MGAAGAVWDLEGDIGAAGGGVSQVGGAVVGAAAVSEVEEGGNTMVVYDSR